MNTSGTYRLSSRYHFSLTALFCINSVNKFHTLQSCSSAYLMKVSTVVLIFINYVGCFQDTIGYIKTQQVYTTNPQWNIYILTMWMFFAQHQLYIKLVNLALYYISLPWFRNNSPLRTETYRNTFFFSVALRPNVGHGLLILEVSRSHTTTHRSR